MWTPLGSVFVAFAVVRIPAVLFAAVIGLRPCTVEAQSHRGLLVLRVHGLRKSAEARDRLASALAAGTDPRVLFPALEVRGQIFD